MFGLVVSALETGFVSLFKLDYLLNLKVLLLGVTFICYF